MSIALGKPIGIAAKGNWNELSPTDYSEMILDSIYTGGYDELKYQD